MKGSEKMKTIPIKDKTVAKVLKEVEQQMISLFGDKLDSVILYGSYAREENSEESDIDVMILVNENETVLNKYEDKITDVIVDLSLEFGVVVSLYLESTKSYKEKVNVLPFLKNVERDGIKLYG